MNKFINILEIINDLDELKKKVYLDSPEIFVDFSDKLDTKNFDEMVLFFATKYGYLSIVKFIIENKIVNLDDASKNNQFKTIREHILEASKQFNAPDINEFLSNYNENKNEDNNINDSIEKSIEQGLESFIKTFEDKLNDLCTQIDDACNDINNEENTDTEDSLEGPDIEKTSEAKPEKIEDTNVEKSIKAESNYEPSFICPNCNCNILENGYSILEKIGYKYSKEEGKIIKTSSEQTNSVTCNKCGYTIEQLNPSFLENICTVQNCKNCGKDLTSSGIVTKVKSEYDKDSNMFISSKKTYHCSECDYKLSDYQANYFMLD